MKNWKTIFKVVVILVSLFSLFYIFMLIYGKVIIADKIGSLTNKKAALGSLAIKPPFTLEIKDLSVEGMAKIERISISPSIVNLLIGRLAFNKVEAIRPEITYEKMITQPANTEPKSSVTVSLNSLLPINTSAHLIFKQIIIKSGKLNFIDHTAGPQGLRVTVQDINLDLINLYTYPSKAVTRFDLEGNIPWQPGNPDGKITLKGWLDYHKKDMKASLNIENIDGIALYPYYSTWVDLEKARIEKAKLNFKSELTGINNDVAAVCRLELTDIVRKPRPPEEPQQKAERITDVVLDMFKALDQGKVILDFTLHMKMDRPEFGFGNIKSAFENKIMDARRGNGFKAQDVLTFPGKVLETGVKSGTDLSRAVIDGVFAIGNEIMKAVEGSFKAEPAKNSK